MSRRFEFIDRRRPPRPRRRSGSGRRPFAPALLAVPALVLSVLAGSASAETGTSGGAARSTPFVRGSSPEPRARLEGSSALVRVGQAAALPRGAVATGEIAPGRVVQFGLAIKPQDTTGLLAYADSVSTPGSPEYHRFLTPAEVAQRFGPTRAEVSSLERMMRAEGLSVAGVSANRLLISLRGPAAEVEGALHTRLVGYAAPGGRRGFVATLAPRLSRSVASSVSAVLGLDSLAAARSQMRRAPAIPRVVRMPASDRRLPRVAPGAPAACTSAYLAALGGGGWTDDQIAHAYGLSSLYARGDLGAGQTIALFELEPFEMSDLAAFDRCYFGVSHTSQVRLVPVDGFNLVGPGSGEAILDVEVLSALAPGAKILVYEAENTTYGTIDEYNTIVSQDLANIVSTSWGECEQALDTGAPGARQLEDYIFAEAAAQGQTVVSAAGDTGSDDCAGTQFSTTKPVQPYLSVDDPASQPYVLGVGGTSLLSDANPPSEVVWNHGAQWGGGGGGVSSSWPIPAWQAGSGVPGVATSGRREVPDVTASADEWRGVTVYSEAFAGQSGGSVEGPGAPASSKGRGTGRLQTIPSGWTTIGGTSSAAPQWAAVLAEIADSGGACSTLPVTAGGRDLGFVSPELYSVASDPSTYASSFTDILHGNNDVFGLGLGYSARPGYSRASGLGSPVVVDASGAGGLDASLCEIAAASSGTARPVVSGLSPVFGPTSGGTTVTVEGSGFPAGNPGAVRVSFGSEQAPVRSVTASSVVVTLPGAKTTPGTAPSGAAGRVDVVVTVRSGHLSLSSLASRSSVFEYIPNEPASARSPTVSGVGPSGGPVRGGNVVVVYGSGFAAGSPPEVTFGGVPSRRVVVRSETELVAVVPPETAATACSTGRGFYPAAACQVEVVVSDANGSSPTVPILPPISGPIVFSPQGIVAPTPETEVAPAATEYDYSPVPHITSISPDPADSNGSSSVTIKGSGFSFVTFDWVNFGPPRDSASEQVQITSITPSTISIAPPPSAGGAGARLPGGVSIQTAGGLSNLYAFAYASVPQVSSLSVLGGSAAGGTRLTIDGTGMSGVTRVEFLSEVNSVYGASTATPVGDPTPTRVEVIVPAGLPGPVDVEPCSPSGCASANPKTDTFVYFTPGKPALSFLSPDSGPAAGGTEVVMFGDNLDGARAVYFGAQKTTLLASTFDYPDGDPYILVANSMPGRAGASVPITIATVNGTVTGGSFSYLPSAPAPPRSLSVHIKGAKATLRWKPPASDGGSPIVSYTVVALAAGQAPAGGTLPPSARSMVIDRIAANHLYTFKVVATNARFGRGVWASLGPVGAAYDGDGYRIAAASGSVAGFGSLADLGGVGGSLSGSTVTGIAGTPGGLGYWLATSDGSVYSFGDAYPFPYVHSPVRVVGIAATPTGDGYWEVTAGGAVYAFGHARYYGEPGQGRRLRGPVVGIASTADGRGYYVVTSAGAVYGRGDAKLVGSAVAGHLGPVVGMAVDEKAPPDRPGYWLLSSSGAVYRFGSARRYRPTSPLRSGPAAAIAATPDGGGYWVLYRSGAVRSFGDAHFEGSAAPRPGGFVAIATD